MFFGRHQALVDIDMCLGKLRFIAGRGLQKNIPSQVEYLLLAVEQAGAGVHCHSRAVFHHHLGAERLEFDVIRVGQILGRGLGP